MSNKINKSFYLVVLTLSFLFNGKAYADKDFQDWLADFQVEATQAGISQKTLNEALTGIQPLPRVIELDNKQPEGQITFSQYVNRIVSKTRIEKGREMMAQNARLLNQVSREYGVAPQYIVALWGIETNFGSNTGGFSIVPALATLAWEGRRGDFFRRELLDALKILEEGHIDAAHMKGSWAGAMGQCQFMPSSFDRYAVDGDHDGRKDIWGTKHDVFASAANYLKQNRWKVGERWGRQVTLPAGFADNLTGLNIRKTLAEWEKLGVRTAGNKPLPVVAGMEGSLIAPEGLEGPVYLVYNNYQTIMRWNRSVYFATSVGLLADAIVR